MKMAKKMLAVVVVLTMVAAFSAIAFAASPSVSFDVGEYADGKATVSAKFVDAVGLTSGSLAFAYPDGKVSKIVKKGGADDKAIGDIDNAFSAEFNNASNPAEFGFYFKNNLWSSAEWKEAADDLDQEGYVNGENFEFAQFVFTADEGTVITVTGELKVGDSVVSVNKSFTIGKAAEPDTTKAAEPDTTKAAEPDTTKAAEPDTTKAAEPDTTKAAEPDTTKAAEPDTTKAASEETTTAKTSPSKTEPGKKTDGGKKTGDNSVLAVMAGVIALAGAAFVVTKKRK